MSEQVKRKSPTYSELLICKKCGSPTEKHGAMQKYCPICSEEQDLERKKLWARDNPAKPEVIVRARSKVIKRQTQRGKENSLKTVGVTYYSDIQETDPRIVLRVSVPFSYGYSKNSIYSMTNHGHLFLRAQTRELRDTLCLAIKNSLNLSDGVFYNAKVYLDIMVEKPNHRGDAVNVLDTVCDAVKDAIGVDDRWFSIRLLDWRIVKEGGNLIVGVSQEATEEQRGCHRCGRFFNMSSFSGNKRKSRVCPECSSVLTKSVNKETPGVLVVIREDEGE